VDEFAKLWGPYLAWLLTVVGWLATHRLSYRREVRKERRAEVDALCKVTAELVAKSRAYYEKDASMDGSKRAAAEIKFDMQRLFLRVERLEGLHSCFDTEGARVELMDSLTGGEFESATRGAVTPDSEVIQRIESDAHFLLDRLEDGFHRAFN
jgi:hypothetical protein